MIIKTYEKIGKRCLTENLMKSQARDYFFKATLCYLVNDDLQGTKNALENYTYEDPSFETTRQKGFLDGIVLSVDESNADMMN